MTEQQSPAVEGRVIIYRDGALRLQVKLDAQTAWVTQAGMAELFQTTPQNITIHIKSIYADGEQIEAATCKEYLQVRTEGGRQVKRGLKHYNLDMILAVGYRVRSHRGTQFRQWATSRLSELLVKGFTLDDERIKAPNRRFISPAHQAYFLCFSVFCFITTQLALLLARNYLGLCKITGKVDKPLGSSLQRRKQGSHHPD
jgi:hypothetical protein